LEKLLLTRSPDPKFVLTEFFLKFGLLRETGGEKLLPEAAQKAEKMSP
jgi:hypothetical protein